MKTFIIFLTSVSLILGVITFIIYANHPLANTKYVKYRGGKWWLIFLGGLALLYLKG